jgi:hypothetical protein
MATYICDILDDVLVRDMETKLSEVIGCFGPDPSPAPGALYIKGRRTGEHSLDFEPRDDAPEWARTLILKMKDMSEKP